MQEELELKEVDETSQLKEIGKKKKWVSKKDRCKNYLLNFLSILGISLTIAGVLLMSIGALFGMNFVFYLGLLIVSALTGFSILLVFIFLAYVLVCVLMDFKKTRN